MDVVYHVKQLSLEIATLEAQLREKKSELEKLLPALSDQERLLMDLPPVLTTASAGAVENTDKKTKKEK
jgi:hypothetical protein